MIPETSLIAVSSVISFLAGSAFGALAVFAISIHRTRHAPLSEFRRERAGALARSALTMTRAASKGKGE
jgi:hypothetical protein